MSLRFSSALKHGGAAFYCVFRANRARFFPLADELNAPCHNRTFRSPSPGSWRNVFQTKQEGNPGKHFFSNIRSVPGILSPAFVYNRCCPVLCIAYCRGMRRVADYFRDACKRRKWSEGDKEYASSMRMRTGTNGDKELE